MADYESVLCVKQEVFVYKIPARTSNRGYRAAEWKLDEPDWTGRLKVVAKQKDLFIKLEDKTSGELFAQCPIESYPSIAIEQVLDSSRYFVVRIQDGSARHAFIGLGFADRGDSFDLLVAIQDHFKQIKREEIIETETTGEGGETAISAGPKLDLGFKEGQTIKLNFTTKKSGESSGPTSKPRPRGQAGASAILLPPPPGGVKVAGPPRPAAPSSSATYSMQPKAPSTSIAAVNNTADLLLDLGISSSSSSSRAQPAASQGETDTWDDFSSLGRYPNPNAPTQKSAADPKTLSWENFD